jgi:hypothetical protein
MAPLPARATSFTSTDAVSLPEGASRLRLSRYRVTLRALEPLDLPAYLGSTLRGAFGHAFRRVACLAPGGGPCPAPEACAYHLIFETAPPADSPALSSLDDVPRPFVIGAPPAGTDGRIPRGSDLAFGLTLVGRAREFFPHFVVTLREIRSIGRGRHPVALRRVEALRPTGGPEAVYDEADSLVRAHDARWSLADCGSRRPPAGPFTLRFLTYTRLKHEDQWARRPEFHVLVRRLLGRLSSLAVFHCGGPLQADFLSLIERAKAVRLVADRTRWEDWTRYSSRQERRMVLGGLVGEAVYEGPVEDLWPYLCFGQWTHVGKNATFGLGRYRIEESA